MNSKIAIAFRLLGIAFCVCAQQRSMITDCVLLTPSTICGNYHNLTEAHEAWNRMANDG